MPLLYVYFGKIVNMGCSQSYPGLSEEEMEDYAMLTYLTKGEIMHILKKFYSIDPEKVKADLNHRFSKEEIVTKFDVLKSNPFQDRLFRVFSSKNDECFSFEDLLDLCSAMSADCPPHVKAAWAFRLFDLDEDNQITAEDIANIIDRLTGTPSDAELCLEAESKIKIANIILEEMKLDNSGSIGLSEFQIITTRLPEFTSSFYFRM